MRNKNIFHKYNIIYTYKHIFVTPVQWQLIFPTVRAISNKIKHSEHKRSIINYSFEHFIELKSKTLIIGIVDINIYQNNN